jgi:hypothetical protein
MENTERVSAYHTAERLDGLATGLLVNELKLRMCELGAGEQVALADELVRMSDLLLCMAGRGHIAASDIVE